MFTLRKLKFPHFCLEQFFYAKGDIFPFLNFFPDFPVMPVTISQ